MIYLMKVRGWQIQDWKQVDLILKPMLFSIIRLAHSRAQGSSQVGRESERCGKEKRANGAFAGSE